MKSAVFFDNLPSLSISDRAFELTMPDAKIGARPYCGPLGTKFEISGLCSFLTESWVSNKNGKRRFSYLKRLGFLIFLQVSGAIGGWK